MIVSSGKNKHKKKKPMKVIGVIYWCNLSHLLTLSSTFSPSAHPHSWQLNAVFALHFMCVTEEFSQIIGHPVAIVGRWEESEIRGSRSGLFDSSSHRTLSSYLFLIWILYLFFGSEIRSRPPPSSIHLKWLVEYPPHREIKLSVLLLLVRFLFSASLSKEFCTGAL